jgi:hypothetical protein
VDPCVSEFDALFTDMFVRAGQLDVVEMIALSHNCLHSIQFRCLESAMVPPPVDLGHYYFQGREDMVPPMESGPTVDDRTGDSGAKKECGSPP